MVLAIFGLGKSAPAQGNGEGMSWNQPILSRGILEILGDSVVGMVDGALTRAVSAVSAVDGIGNTVSAAAGSAFALVTGTGAGASYQMPEAAVSQAVVQEPTVQRPVSQYECTMNDVVCPVTPKIASQGTALGF